MKPFELIEHTADVGIKAHGSILTELFENAARGMFSVITRGGANPQGSQVEKNIEINKDAGELEDMLVSWLSELLYIFNREKICFNSFKITGLNNNSLKAAATGVNIDLYQSDLYTEIKAVTYSGLKIKKASGGYEVEIIFDV